MATKLHQLLLLLCLFVASLPTCSSQFVFQRPRHLSVLRQARREAFLEQRDGWRETKADSRFAEKMTESAAKQANVTARSIMQAFVKKEEGKKKLLLFFSAWSEDCISHLMHCVSLSSCVRDIDVDCYRVYAAEGMIKQGGIIYQSVDRNAPIVSNASNVDLPTDFLFMPCLAMDEVDDPRRCASIVDPIKAESFVRSYAGDDIHLQLDLEYNPRNPETFDKDASFLVWENEFFPGYYALESVSYPGSYQRATSDGLIQISPIEDTDDFRNAASFAIHDYSTQCNYPCSSCKEIRDLDVRAPSGEYSIKTLRGKTLKNVYCEMGLNDGGYTFVKPQDLPRLRNDEVQALFTDKTSFLMRAYCPDSTQPYGVLKQLPMDYGGPDIPLKLGLNEFTGYTPPRNLDFLGPNFVFFGFVPSDLASNEQGFQLNGENVVSRDGTPHSHIALFPNFAERPSSDNTQPPVVDVCDDLLENPSGRVMPAEYFTFIESPITKDGETAAIGFR